ncbi:MAG: hypothetical protein Q8M08_01500 [Bacteroidales bacterium]|nr:hypothetical protein [Bacteroidales bacterium]
MNKVELENDFLGGQGPLTREEEKALSEFLKKRKIIKKPSRLFDLSAFVVQQLQAKREGQGNSKSHEQNSLL